MINIRKHALYVFLVIFIPVCNFLFSIGFSFTKYDYKFEFGSYRCVPNETSFQAENVSDPLACGRVCFHTIGCLSFSFHQDTLQCIGCRHSHFGSLRSYGYTEFGRLMYFSVDLLGTDCLDILQHQPNAQSGLYEIRLWESKEVLTVYCDMETEGGGWTVFQNRSDGSVSFDRTFLEYENGFGTMAGEYWIGLKYVKELADQEPTEVILDMYPFTGSNSSSSETVQNFRLSGPPTYTLSIDTVEGGNIHSFQFNNGGDFAVSNAGFDSDKCDERIDGAWSYKDGCTYVSLNGEYGGIHNYDEIRGFKGIIHYSFGGTRSFQKSKMMLRRVRV